MPDITATSLFDSLKFISTDASGNLLETESIAAKKANKVVDGLTIEAVAAGSGGNDLQFAITSDNATGSIAYSLASNILTLNLGGDAQIAAVAAIKASKTLQGITFTAASAGVAGNDISIELVENQGGTNEVTETGSVVSINLAASASSVDADTIIALDYSAITLIENPTGSGTTSLNSFSNTNLEGGADLVPSVPAVDGKAKHDLDAIVLAFASASSEIKDVFNVTGAGSSFITSNVAATNLQGGEDEILGELDPSASYLLIKQSDLHDLANDEQNDGRKLVWGFVNKVAAKFSALQSQPDSLRIVKGVPTSTDSGTALKQTYTITAKYAVTGLDLKPEA